MSTDPRKVEVTITIVLERREIALLSDAVQELKASTSNDQIAGIFDSKQDMHESLASMQGKVHRAILAAIAPERPPPGTWSPRGGMAKG
jgi:hypothetical protein